MVNLRGCPKCTGNGVARTRVNYAAIMQAFTDAGIFGPDIHALARETKDQAQKLAPRRTGRMAEAHYINIQPPRGYTRVMTVANRMGYANFVQGGTAGKGTGFIDVKPPRAAMELRPAPYSLFGPNDPRRFQKRVRGQKPQDWLNEAMKQALRNRGLRIR